jgi:hypothetical protein
MNAIRALCVAAAAFFGLTLSPFNLLALEVTPQA